MLTGCLSLGLPPMNGITTTTPSQTNASSTTSNRSPLLRTPILTLARARFPIPRTPILTLARACVGACCFALWRAISVYTVGLRGDGTIGTSSTLYLVRSPAKKCATGFLKVHSANTRKKNFQKMKI